ncbi:MAG TPA: hypothetical protein VK641_07285, partial [Terriglobales bacterium]|nr:hypothetical protein [Terriglobales bacterium]
PTLQYGRTLPQAQIDFRRTIAVDPAHPVIYCEEQATNLSAYDRPISWNEHVTFGPPFLECETTIFDMPATRSRVNPPGYSERMFLEPDAEFLWPNAPTQQGATADLRKTPDRRFGHYTAQLLDPGREIAFISACNPAQQLLVVYVFRRAEFPWVGNWEERNNRTAAPWKARTFCRGIEFSTTPFPIPRRDTIDQGLLFGERTYRWLPAKATRRVRFLILLFRVAEGFAGVRDVTVGKQSVQVVESAANARVLTVSAGGFL